MALHSYSSNRTGAQLSESEAMRLRDELRRFGLLDDIKGMTGAQMSDVEARRLRDNAPQMPVPELDRTEGGVLPQMPMAAPPGGFNPMQMGGGGGPNIFDIFRQSQNTKYVGGYDPLAAGGQGINWNIGRQGQTGPAGAK